MYRQNGMRSMMLNNIMSELWEQHIMWTRSFIISTAENLKDLDMVTKRLLRNPEDFANILRMFYGVAKANQFKDLLTEHLLIAADLVNYAKKGDKEKADEARTKWYKNADDIAEFLASINPYWDKKEWQKLLYDHLKMTESEAAERLSGQYAEDIQTYEAIEDEALKMADYMANGILEQIKY